MQALHHHHTASHSGRLLLLLVGGDSPKITFFSNHINGSCTQYLHPLLHTKNSLLDLQIQFLPSSAVPSYYIFIASILQCRLPAVPALPCLALRCITWPNSIASNLLSCCCCRAKDEIADVFEPDSARGGGGKANDPKERTIILPRGGGGWGL